MTYIDFIFPVILGFLTGFAAINPMLVGCCIDTGIQHIKRFGKLLKA